MRTTLMGAALAALSAGVLAVGASMLVLQGSDSAPGSGKGEAACAGALQITNPVSQSGHDNEVIGEVSVTGDLTECAGQTMLVEVDLDAVGEAHAYAVYLIPEGAESVTLAFDPTSGDFYDTKPLPTGGTLVAAGDRLSQQRATDFGLVTVTIASRWS